MNSLPLQFLIIAISGWVNRRQRDAIEYLQEENRILRELGNLCDGAGTHCGDAGERARAGRVDEAGCDAFVVMVGPADLSNLGDAAAIRLSRVASFRTIHLEGLVRVASSGYRFSG